MSKLNTFIVVTTLSEYGSKENGTVHNGNFFAAIKNGLYLCNAFETQMPEIEY